MSCNIEKTAGPKLHVRADLSNPVTSENFIGSEINGKLKITSITTK